jgi:hypothetical protein
VYPEYPSGGWIQRRYRAFHMANERINFDV